MKQKLLLAFSLILILTSTGCGSKIPKLQNGEETVATLEGKSISAEELYKKLKQEGGTSVLIDMVDSYISDKEISDSEEITNYVNTQYEQAKTYYESYLNQKFDDILKSSGFNSTDDYKEYIKKSYKKQLLIEKYVKENVSKDEINDYYEKSVFAPITVKYILVETETKEDMTEDDKKAAKEKALEKAKNIIKEIQEGKKTFDEALEEYSKDTSDAVTIEYTTDIDAAFLKEAKGLSIGKYSTTPIESEYGYNIIYKESIGEKPSLDSIKENIIETIATNKLSADQDSKLANQTLVKIRKKYKLDVIDTDINELYKKAIKDYE